MTWALAAISLTATVANIYNQRWCFWLWLGTNCCWRAIDWHAGIPAQAALHGVYAGLAVWGLWKWSITKETVVMSDNLAVCKMRVQEEKRALDDKIERLTRFIGDCSQPSEFLRLLPAAQSNLRVQLAIMQSLSTVLGERLDTW